MSTNKTFRVRNMAEVAPLTFDLEDAHGNHAGTFRVPRKLPINLVDVIAAVRLDTNGNRIYEAGLLIEAMLRIVADKAWNATKEKWEPVDDRDRLRAVLNGDEWEIEVETLGEIVMWVIEETTGHPTPARRPSSPGRSTTNRGSKASASRGRSTSKR